MLPRLHLQALRNVHLDGFRSTFAQHLQLLQLIRRPDHGDVVVNAHSGEVRAVTGQADADPDRAPVQLVQKYSSVRRLPHCVGSSLWVS